MKLISADDLDDAVYDMSSSMDLDYDQISNYLDGMSGVRAVVIPEDATNGDVLLAAFPGLEVKQLGDTVTAERFEPYCKMQFSSEWWNTPYNEEQRDYEEHVLDNEPEER